MNFELIDKLLDDMKTEARKASSNKEEYSKEISKQLEDTMFGLMTFVLTDQDTEFNDENIMDIFRHFIRKITAFLASNVSEKDEEHYDDFISCIAYNLLSDNNAFIRTVLRPMAKKIKHEMERIKPLKDKVSVPV